MPFMDGAPMQGKHIEGFALQVGASKPALGMVLPNDLLWKG